MYRDNKMKFLKGQTLLIMLVISGFVMVVLSSALILSVTGSKLTISSADAAAAAYGADAGIENGLIRYLRDPAYTGETISIGRASVVITITGVGPYTIRAVSTAGLSERVTTANITMNSGIMTVNNWQDNY